MFLLYFGLMFMLRNRFHFNSDEYDNLLGGMVVANGGEIYKDFTSQHTPMLYYICALFYLIGVRIVVVYRLMIYALLSVIWVGMYFRYGKTFGKTTMIVYPILYITLMYNADTVSHCILSEQFQSQALVVLLLEFLQYKRLKYLTVSSYICISLAVLFSFGTAFVSIYPIFIIALGVFINEICNLVKIGRADKKQWSKDVKKTLFSGVGLIFLCLLPFAVIIIVYAIKGNVGNAIYGIYTVNRVYYPKYGGVTSSIIESFFSPFHIIMLSLQNTGIFSVNISIISVLLVSLYFFCKRDIIKGTVCLGFIYMCAMRAIAGFHGMPFLATGMLFFALIVHTVYSFVTKRMEHLLFSRYKTNAVAFIMVLIILMPSIVSFKNAIGNRELLFSKEEFKYKVAQGSIEEVITTVTDYNDKIYDATITLLYIPSQRLPIRAPSLVCPWIYEAYHDMIFESMDEEKPKIIYLPDEFDVWGNKSNVFAADAYKWIRNRYKSFESICGIHGLYVINDYYQEAANRWKSYKKVS